MYNMYIDALNNIPSYTHGSSYIVWTVHPKAVKFHTCNHHF